MRTVRRIVVMAAILLALGVIEVARAQQPQGEPFTTEIRKLKEGFYVIPGYDGQITGGNVGVRVTSEGVILADSNKIENIAAVISKVKSVTSQPIKYEFGTHSHADHSAGSAELVKLGTVMISHRNMRDEMVKGKLASPPSIVFDTQMSLFLGGAEVRAYHFADPAHTTGDTVVYFPDVRIVQTGDLVLWGKRSNGETLAPGLTSLKGFIANADGMLKLDFDMAIPGHGPVLSKEQVQTYRQKLVTLQQRVADFIKAGGKKADLSAKIKLDDLNWPLQQRVLENAYTEAGGK